MIVCLSFSYTHGPSENKLRKVTDPILTTGQIKIVRGGMGYFPIPPHPFHPRNTPYYLEVMATQKLKVKKQ
jgi:hypothetical protein